MVFLWPPGSRSGYVFSQDLDPRGKKFQIHNTEKLERKPEDNSGRSFIINMPSATYNDVFLLSICISNFYFYIKEKYI